jgi:hypothetical protein
VPGTQQAACLPVGLAVFRRYTVKRNACKITAANSFNCIATDRGQMRSTTIASGRSRSQPERSEPTFRKNALPASTGPTMKLSKHWLFTGVPADSMFND